MAYERFVEGSLDYSPCRYGKSKLLFRGPKADLSSAYVSFIGSTETYGKFVERPFPHITSTPSGIATLNLGYVNAGVDTFHDDPTVLDIARGGVAAVVQVMGAHNLSNRYYSVHPRRNDRFLAASRRLKALYPEADFAEIHFTKHLLSMLRDICPHRFDDVLGELRASWVSRMASLIGRIGTPVVLLWISERRADEAARAPSAAEPLFITRAMLDELSVSVAELVEVPVPRNRTGIPRSGMVVSEVEVPAALVLPGPDTHARIAAELAPALHGLEGGRGWAAARGDGPGV